MPRVLTMLLLLPLALYESGVSWAQTGSGAGDAGQASSAPASQPVSRDEALWQRITSLHQQIAKRPRDASPLADAVPRRRMLLERVRLYLTLYPGGPHRDEAVRLELATLFELTVLSGGEPDRLAARVREYLRNPPSQSVLHEAAYWSIFCERMQRPATTWPTTAPVDGPDPSLLAAYREYIQRYPTSRYVPRLATLVFEQAQRADDRETMRRLVKRLSVSFPEHAATAVLAAQLRRAEAVGHAFWLTFRDANGEPVDTRELVGQPVLIVVWAGFDAAARECVKQVEAFRRDHPQVRVVGVNLDATPAQMSAACDALAIDWPQFNDGLGWANRFARTWGVRSIPTVFVVDRDGRLTGAGAAGEWPGLVAPMLHN